MKDPLSTRSGMGIRSRIFILLLILFVPLLLLQSIAFYKWYLESKESGMQANLELARSVAKNFETFLNGLVRGELATGLAITASLPMADQDRDHMLESFQADNPAIRSIFWMNSDGLVIASSVRTYIGFDLKDRSFFQGVKEGKDWAVSELIVGRATGKPAFTVSRGIRNEKGDLLGVVAAAIEPDRLDPLLAVPRSKNAGISLIDSKGIHVYRYPATNRDYTPEQRNWLKSYPILGDALKGKEVVSAFRSKIRGEERLVAFVPIASIGWVASCSRAEGEVIADILKAMLPQAVLILLVTLAAFGAAIWFSRPITSSIRRLQQHAAALGRGERERLETAPDPREIKILAETFNDMAEKVRFRETALRESEAKYRDLFENMSEGFFLAEVLCDDSGSPVDYRYLDANIAFVQLTGLKREEIIGRTVREVLPGVEDQWIKTYGRVALTRNPAIIDEFTRPLGRHYHTVAYSPRRGQFACLFQDITEHKQAEEALRESEERFRIAQELSPDGFTILRPVHEGSQIVDFEWVYENATIARLNGTDPEKVVGRRLSELLPSHANTPFHEIYRQVAESGEPCTMEAPYEGDTIRNLTWFRVAVVPIGKDIAVLSQDITERKRAEEALRQSQEELRGTLDATQESIWVFSPECVILNANRKGLERMGKTAQEIIGKRIAEVLPPELGRAREKRVMEVASSGLMTEFEDERAGMLFHHSFYPVMDQAGRLKCVVSFSRDITEQKTLQEALRRSHDQLETRILERTAELERKNRELQNFAFIASHDLNEPLRKIQTFGSLLEAKSADRLDQQQRDYISRITGSANRMQELLAALLDYSRIEAKGEDFSSTSLDVVVLDAISDLEVAIRSAGSQVRAEPLPTVKGDPCQLRQLFQNLLGNAIKYRRPDVTNEIKISGEETIGYCRILVEDNGIGFEERFLDKIFIPFQRLHRKHEYSGTGIGLAICKKVVERHGGTITAKSTPGKGSTFIVTLPVNGEKR